MHAPNNDARLSGEELSAFQVIVDFVTNLHTYFEDKNQSIQSIQLYHRLIYHKSFGEVDLIRKHVNLFRDFCRANRTAIRDRNAAVFAVPRIQFSERIYIDVPYILSKVDSESVGIIWEYLLAISAQLDPQNNTRAVLEQMQAATSSSSTASNAAADPLAMMNGLSTLMGNPAISNMMTSLMSNEIDLHKLITSITPIVENVKKEIEQSDDPTIKNMIAMIQSTIDTPEQKETSNQ